MSHWITIQTQVKDLAALSAAAKELGLEIEIAKVKGERLIAKGYSPAGYSQNKMECDARIFVKQESPLCQHSRYDYFRYDIAVVRQAKDGTYSLITDWWDGKKAIVGENFAKLIQLYGVHKTTLEAKKRGWIVQRQGGKNGNINVVLTGVA